MPHQAAVLGAISKGSSLKSTLTVLNACSDVEHKWKGTVGLSNCNQSTYGRKILTNLAGVGKSTMAATLASRGWIQLPPTSSLNNETVWVKLQLRQSQCDSNLGKNYTFGQIKQARYCRSYKRQNIKVRYQRCLPYPYKGSNNRSCKVLDTIPRL